MPARACIQLNLETFDHLIVRYQSSLAGYIASHCDSFELTVNVIDFHVQETKSCFPRSTLCLSSGLNNFSHETTG